MERTESRGYCIAADRRCYVIKPNQNKSYTFGDISACLKWINLLMYLLVRAFVSN